MNFSSEIEVIFEDDDLLVINKPAGMVVNRSHTIQNDDMTVQDWVEKQEFSNFKFQISNDENREVSSENGEQVEEEELSDEGELEEGEGRFYLNPEKIFAQRSGIAHRLDKETSGVLLIAKKPDVLVNLLQQFKARTTQKSYVALVHGKFQTDQGDIDLPIGRNSKFRLQYAVRENGKQSLTHYRVEQFYPRINVEAILKDRDDETKQYFQEVQGQQRSRNFKKLTKLYQGFSFVKVFPKTGRTHQIRVHFAHLQHPIVGDKLYVGKKRQHLDEVWCQRHFLHAEKLTIMHPTTQKEITFTAPLTPDLERVKSYLMED